MKKFRAILIFTVALLLLVASGLTFQYREARSQMEREIAVGNYPAALNKALTLRRTVLLWPLWWGTPFFMRDVAAEIAFVEGEGWHALGEKTKARESYARAAELFSDSRKRARAYYNNAAVALEMEKYLEARDLLHRALDPLNGDPHHSAAKVNLELLEGQAAGDAFKLSGKGGGRTFGERDPFSPWSKDQRTDNKPGEKRR